VDGALVAVKFILDIKDLMTHSGPMPESGSEKALS